MFPFGTSGVSLWYFWCFPFLYFWCFPLVLLVFLFGTSGVYRMVFAPTLPEASPVRASSEHKLSEHTSPLSPSSKSSDFLFRLKLNEVKCLLSEAPNYFDCGCFGWSQSAPIRTIKKIGRVSEIREIRTLQENCGQQQSTKG